jgi:hypothetical protein
VSRRQYYDKWLKALDTRNISRLLVRGKAILAGALCICGTSLAADVFERGNLLAFYESRAAGSVASPPTGCIAAAGACLPRARPAW